MSVKVTLTVEVGEGSTRSTHVVDSSLWGSDRFAADAAVVATLRALTKVLALMPERQHEMQDELFRNQRQWPPV